MENINDPTITTPTTDESTEDTDDPSAEESENVNTGPVYITSAQLAVVETLLVGLRKKCISDFYTTLNDGYLKVACTQILLESGYSTLEFLDPNTPTATLLTLPETSTKPEATTLLGPKIKDRTERDVITRVPQVHFEVRSFPEIGNSTAGVEDLERGIERLLNSHINVLVVACGAQVYTTYQQKFATLLPPLANFQPYLADSKQFLMKKESIQKGEEFTLRACRVASPIPNMSRVIFALHRPNTLQKQVEQLLKEKSKLERDNSDLLDDKVTLASELESLKQEIALLATDRDEVDAGKGEFEAERDLIREERDELRVESAALKGEMQDLRKEMHKLELELEAFKEESNKKLVLSDDESDLEVDTLNLQDASIEVDGDDEVPAPADLNLDMDSDSDGELDKVTPKLDTDSDASEKAGSNNQILVDDGEDSDLSVGVDDETPKTAADKSDDLKLDSDSDSEIHLEKKNETKTTNNNNDLTLDSDSDPEIHLEKNEANTTKSENHGNEEKKEENEDEDDGGDSSDWSDA
eukprot:Phypoly_transcript_07008.p1 GENE.Phypoly_transcript_07008~~Phypoly_transcript_07008.p1  ORF type:complete len:527 (+),score=140.20 Phypoly_transcript_07008:92-1672(+)